MKKKPNYPAAILALVLVGAVALECRPSSQVPPASDPASAGSPPGATPQSDQRDPGCLCGDDCQCAAACEAALADAYARIAELEANGGVERQPTLASDDTHTLMLFSATWCQPCGVCHTYADDMAADGWEVVEVDRDASPALFTQYNVESVPTWIILEDGVEEVRWRGNSRADVVNNCAVALSRDHHVGGVEGGFAGTMLTSYTTEPATYSRVQTSYAYRTYTSGFTRQRERCPECGRRMPRRRGW